MNILIVLVVIFLLPMAAYGASTADTKKSRCLETPYQINDVRHIALQSALPALHAAGFTPAELKAWKPFAVQQYCWEDMDGTYLEIDVGDFTAWKRSGWSPKQASVLSSAGLDAKEAKEAKKLALPLKLITTFARHGLTIPAWIHDSEPAYKKYCKGSLHSIEGINPYAATNKCFLIEDFRVLQLLNAHYVLAYPIVGNGNVLIAYSGYAPTKGQSIEVLAIGVKAFKYQTTAGNQAIVPLLYVIHNYFHQKQHS